MTTSNEEKREVFLHQIAAWREACAAAEPGSPQHREFKNNMKMAEWKLQELGPSQAAPGIVIKIVDPDNTKK